MTVTPGATQWTSVDPDFAAMRVATRRAAPDTAQCSQKLTLAANRSYTLSAWVSGNYAYLGTGGASANGSTWTSSSGYTKVSVRFTTGSSGTVTIWVHGWYGQGAVYVDDVAIA